MTIAPVDTSDAATRQRIVEYLRPHETHALFILGNLKSDRPVNLYAAESGGDWLGLAAYYPVFKSFNPFSYDPRVSAELAAHVAGLHPDIDMLLGMDQIARPAFERLASMGYRTDDDLDDVFMELDGVPPPQRWEELGRLYQPSDAEAITRILKVMRGGHPSDPLTQGEIERATSNTSRFVVVKDGQIVATAGTSGIGISACQIIGVATHPDHRRMGYASAACAAIIRYLAAQGAQKTVLFTGARNVGAQQCYLRMGFVITGKYIVAKLRKDDVPA